MKMRPEIDRVLQGYFRIERFQGTGSGVAVVQPMLSGRGTLAPAPAPPRPDLLPAKMLSVMQVAPHAAQPKPRLTISGVPRPDLLPAKMSPMVGQPKAEREAGREWSGAPRLELLPGMGTVIVGALRGMNTIAQPRTSTSKGALTTQLPAGQLRVIGPGRPLESGIRREMEAFFQADFSGVRVHEGPVASQMGALAFTLGETLYFAPGVYDPTTREGVELLGHELTHVVQQRDGRVSNPYGRGVAIVQDPGLEAEADAMGRRVAEEIWVGMEIGRAVMGWEKNSGGGSSLAGVERGVLSSGLQLRPRKKVNVHKAEEAEKHLVAKLERSGKKANGALFPSDQVLDDMNTYFKDTFSASELTWNIKNRGASGVQVYIPFYGTVNNVEWNGHLTVPNHPDRVTLHLTVNNPDDKNGHYYFVMKEMNGGMGNWRPHWIQTGVSGTRHGGLPQNVVNSVKSLLDEFVDLPE